MADDDIQLNFGAPAPRRPAAPKPAKTHSPNARDSAESKKRARPTTSLSDIKTGVWQKQDKELQKAKKSSGPSSRREFSSPTKPASSRAPEATSSEGSKMQVDDEPKQQVEAKENKDDLSQFEPANKRTKPLTSKQKLMAQESDYASYVKTQKADSKKAAEAKKGIVYETMKDLSKTMDVFSDKTFADLELSPHLVENITERMCLDHPTQIQQYSIPVLLSRRDALIKAQTGSGKTLSYLIPIVQDLVNTYARKVPVDEGTDGSTSSEESSDSDSENGDSGANSMAQSGADSDRESISGDSDSEEEDDGPKVGSVSASGRVMKYRAGQSIVNTTASKQSNDGEPNGDGEEPKKKTRRPPKLDFDRASGTHAIIISPTRELSLQIYEVLCRLLKPFPQIVPGVIMGGEKRKSEKARLRKGVNILVATPGRLVDHLVHTQSFQIEKCRWLVLDEADRLLDMGFERDLTSIINALNAKKHFSKRQSVLASATLNRDINRLALLSLVKPVYIAIEAPASTTPGLGDQGSKSSSSIVRNEEDMDEFDSNIPEDERVHEIPTQLKQHVVVVDDKRKMVTLVALIRARLKQPGTKIIVFFSTCESVDFYYMLFSMAEVGTSLAKGKEVNRERLLPASLFKLHGNLSQDVRSSTYSAFSACSSGVLFCTDVAARGLDVPSVNWIIQYDVPSDPAAYVHRIGRTARIGASGDAVLLLLSSERSYLEVLEKRQMKLNEIPQTAVLKDLHVYLEPNPGNDPLQEASSLQHLLDKLVEVSKQVELKNIAINAFQGFLRSYATHTKTTKHIFHIKNLHLGHLSRNFALRDPPSTFGKTLQNAGLGKKEAQRIKERAREKERKKLKVKPAGVVTADEFSAM